MGSKRTRLPGSWPKSTSPLFPCCHPAHLLLQLPRFVQLHRRICLHKTFRSRHGTVFRSVSRRSHYSVHPRLGVVHLSSSGFERLQTLLCTDRICQRHGFARRGVGTPRYPCAAGECQRCNNMVKCKVFSETISAPMLILLSGPFVI